MAEEYSGHTKNVANQTTGAVKGAHTQDSLKGAETNLRVITEFTKNSKPMLTNFKVLLERFANSTSFDDLFASINQIYTDADNDPELKGWFKDIDRFVRKCLKEQGYVLQDESDQAWNKLYDQGNFLLRDRYRNHTNRIVDETKFLAEQFEKDPQNQQFGKSMEKLFNDLGQDENGKPEFKPHLLKDLSEVILPGFFENVRYVPIPRIEFSDSMIDAVVENLVIEGDNLAPNMMEFGSDNYWKWGRKTFTSKNKNSVLLSVSGIQMDLRDVAYYVKKKEGFPGVTDKGVMDVFLGGTGLSFKVAMETADKSDKQHFFKISKVTVELKNLNIKLKQSNHKLLFGLFKPLLFKVLRPVIQKAVEKQIRDSVTQADAFLYQVKKEVDRAVEEAKNNPDPENLQNIYQRYFNAFQKQMQKGEQKKKEMEAKKADTKVNVALTQHDSIFKNIALPGGISTKATEYKDLAAKGEEWQSPVFSIGSASESKSLPSAANVSRKPHDVTGGGVRNKDGTSAEAPSVGSGAPGVGSGAGAGGAGASGVGAGAGAGFSSQVNEAFKPNTTTDTTLGRNNPVLQGQV